MQTPKECSRHHSETTMKDFNYALMLLKANRFEAARELLEELLQGDPGNQDISSGFSGAPRIRG